MEKRKLRIIGTILGVSLLLSFALCAGAFLAAFRYSSERGSGGFAVLSVADTVPEEDLLGLLGQSGIQHVVSSSDEWVFVDGFDALERVPLNQFSSRIAPFDLRDDAYAARLADIFVSGGVRRVFISTGMQSFFLNGESLLKRINTALEGFSPEVRLFGSADLAVPYLILFSLATLILMLRLRARRILSFSLPALGALALAGSSGFVLAALLFTVQRLCLDPIREFIRNRFSRRPAPHSGRDPIRLAVGAGVAVLGLTVVQLGAVPRVVALLAALSYAALTWIGLWIEAVREQERGHSRFLPLSLHREPLLASGVFSAVLPFFLAAMIAFLLVSGVNPRSRYDSTQAALQGIGVSLSTADYDRHLQLQTSFSVRALSAGVTAPVYERYTLDEDGLVAAGSEPVPDPAYDAGPLPPLEALLLSAGASRRPLGHRWGDLFAAGLSGLVVIAVAQNNWFAKRGKGSMSSPKDKRVAA